MKIGDFHVGGAVEVRSILRSLKVRGSWARLFHSAEVMFMLALW